MNTKTIYVLHKGPQCISTIANLKLSRQISTIRLFLEKTHTKVKVSWPSVFQVIDKGMSVKMSSTPLQSAISLEDISIATGKYDIDLRWLPTVLTTTKMDPSQSKPIMRLPIPTERIRYNTILVYV